MIKKWSLIIGLIVLVSYGLSFVRTVTYVPFKSINSRITAFDRAEIVALPEDFFILKRQFPNLKKILSIHDLQDHQVVFLPWQHVHGQKLVHLKVNGHSFYDAPEGAIQVTWFRKNDDGYSHFLKENIKLTAAGTVVLARGVHKVIQRHNDIHYPWKGTRQFFNESDINIVNFKSPLVTEFSYPKSSWLLVGKLNYANAMASANIHLVSLAGNHMGDAKTTGLNETLTKLTQLNIKTVGAGSTLAEAYQCEIIKKKGVTFGFVGFNNVPGSIGKPKNNHPGIAWLDNDAIKAIKTCRPNVDQLIVLVNWGIEYTHQPRKKEQAWAKRMIQAGADIVLGDQAHWVQSFDTINGKHVSYGLGNYIFDQHWSQYTTEGIIQTFVFYQNKKIAIDTIPIKLQRNGQVQPIEPSSDRYWHVLKAYNNKSNNI